MKKLLLLIATVALFASCENNQFESRVEKLEADNLKKDSLIKVLQQKDVDHDELLLKLAQQDNTSLDLISMHIKYNH